MCTPGKALIAAMALLMTSGLALADAPQANPADEFLANALQTSMTQVELGKLAQKNAQSAGVNALGVRLQRDHARIGKMLATLANQKGVTVPVSLDSHAAIDSLSAKSGAEFDAAYSAQMVRDHETAIALFTAAESSSDADLRQVARLALPTLREDERLAASFDKLNPNSVQAVARRQ